MKVIINQSKKSKETVSSEVIQKLYELSISGDISENDLTGNITVEHTKSAYLTELLKYLETLNINSTGVNYMEFEDPLVEWILLHICDSDGFIENNILTQIQSSSSEEFWFTGMPITKFNEAKLFYLVFQQLLNFKDCSKLTEITINDLITMLLYQFFTDCSSLTKVDNLKNITNFSIGAIRNTLLKLNIAEDLHVENLYAEWGNFNNNEFIGSEATPEIFDFSSSKFISDFYYQNSVKKLIMPKNLKNDRNQMYIRVGYCPYLEEIEFPENFETANFVSDSFVITLCPNLKIAPIFPENITSLGNRFYSFCLLPDMDIVIPSHITTLNEAFYMSNVHSITIMATSLPYILTQAFVLSNNRYKGEGRTENITVNGVTLYITTSPYPIYVPDNLYDAYKNNTNWSRYYSEDESLNRLFPLSSKPS